jgi:hypothetical protein
METRMAIPSAMIGQGDLSRESQLKVHASDRIRDLRNQTRSFATRRELVNEIHVEFSLKGIEFFSSDDRAYLKPRCIPFPIEINTGNLFSSVLNYLSLTRGERLFELVVEDLKALVHRKGKRVQIRQFSIYNSITNTLYVSNCGQEIVKITPVKIETVPNGTDGVLFLEPRMQSRQPMKLVDDPEVESIFREKVIESVNFSDNAHGMSKASQQRLFESWVESVYFPELNPTRPILVLSGEKGSGKSSAARMIGRLIFGPDFEVRHLPDTPAEFDVATTNERLVAFDNVDSLSKWLEDKLAGCATGATITRRRLYTENEQETFTVTARIVLTSRTPRFRREDVAERLIILSLSRFGCFRPECELDEEFVRNRDLLFSGLMHALQGVLQSLEATGDFHYQGEQRLADFASFSMRNAIGRGEEREMAEALSSLLTEQEAFSYEESALFAFLQEWVEETGGGTNPIPTADLFKVLRAFSDENGQDFLRIAGNPISLGRKLSELSRLVDCPLLIESKPLSGRRKAWTICASQSKP